MRKILFILSVAFTLCLTLCAQTRSVINTGATANDGTGDSARTAFNKVNTNFSTLWAAVYTNGIGATNAFRFATNAFLTDGTNISLNHEITITNKLTVEGSLTNDVEFEDIARLTLDSTDGSFLGVASLYLDGGITTLRGTTNLQVITPAVLVGTATTNQVLTLTDAVEGTVEFTDANFLPLSGGTMSGAINMGSQRITSLATPSAQSDATTRAYVDDKFYSAGSFATNMMIWRAKRFQDSLTPSGKNPRIMCIGDSTVRGINTTEVVTRTNMHLFSWPYWLARHLQSNGIPATADSFWGAGGSSFSSSPPITSLDSRLTRSGSGIGFSESSLGGQALSGSASGSVTFTPLGQCDTVEIHWIRNTGLGTFSYSIDGGTATNVATAGASSMQKTTVYLGSLTNHSITIAWVSGTWYVRGLDCYDSTSSPRQISVWNMGMSGNTSASMIGSGNPWSPNNFVTWLDPDLVIIEGGVINDWRTSVASATSKANIEMIATNAAVGASVVMLTPAFDSGSGGLTADQNTYVQNMLDIADTYGYGIINWRLSIGSSAISVAAGLIDDSVHPTSAGNSDIAYSILKILR